jgi:hypothetical protein
MLHAIVEHAPLAVTLAIIYWKLTPRVLKATLTNGGGEIVRRIVREENATQSTAIDEKFTGVRERLAVIETRFTDHLTAAAR